MTTTRSKTGFLLKPQALAHARACSALTSRAADALARQTRAGAQTGLSVSVDSGRMDCGS